MGETEKYSCDNQEHFRAGRTLAMTFIPAMVIFTFLTLQGMSPWPATGLTLALIGLTLLVNGRIAWLRPALKGALDAAHSDVNMIDAAASQPAVITDLPSINDGRRRL